MELSNLSAISLLLLAISSIILTCTFKTYAQQTPVQQLSDTQTVSPTQVNLQDLPTLPSTSESPVVIPAPRIPIGEEALDRIKAIPCPPARASQPEELPPPSLENNDFQS